MLKGHLLNDRYQIKETIGGGGMANVYLARDIILDRDVAIKALRMEYADDQEFIARFDREAQSATSLSHPNIVSIYDVGEEDHLLYMAMEYVDGMTLKEYIQRYGPLDVQVALDIMKQITAAIAHAHENEIVHRDIKPQNILIDSYGQIKVTDFGIAVALSATALTQTNSILGSVHYLSPEQARGGMATKKSDIYSLGIVLYELLTARLPFSGQSPVSIALQHLQSDTPSVRRFNPKVPQSVENIVLKATSKDPFHRFKAVAELEDELETALNPERLHEGKFTPPAEAGEETKAIPIITDNQLSENENGDTIVHHNGDSTTKAQKSKQQARETPKKTKKKKEKRKKWPIILSIVLFLLIAGAAAFTIPGLLEPKDVDIPDVSNMEYEEAMTQLRELNLQTEREMMYSDEVDEGYVIKTDPEANSTVKENDMVTIFVSQGKEKVVIEDYVGENYNQVERLLLDKGYKDVIAYGKFSDKPVGEIITQTQPSPDSEVVPSDTKVIFEISNGPEKITLNNLEGMTEQEAVNNLESQGLIVSVTEEYADDTPKGEIVRQKPEAYTELEEGDTVEVFVSKGPKEKPPVNVTKTFTVSYNPDKEPENENEAVEQTVKIYIGDTNHSLSEVFKEETITDDKEYSITLTIAQGNVGEYKVWRDDEVIIDKSIPYEEVDE